MLSHKSENSHWETTDLRESTVVPDVSVMGEAIAHVAQTTLLDVLLDRVERLLLRDLHLGIGPAGNFDDHVEDAVVLVREKWDIVEGGHNRAILLDVDSVI
jgi:hypothetical protein